MKIVFILAVCFLAMAYGNVDGPAPGGPISDAVNTRQKRKLGDLLKKVVKEVKKPFVKTVNWVKDGIKDVKEFQDRKVPQSTKEIGVNFHLHTRQTAAGGQLISEADITNFDGCKDTKFITHGFNSNGNTKWVRQMREAILERENVNVIVVDWENGAKQPLLMYDQAAANTREVGRLIAKLMTALQSKTGAKFAKMHLIGHSLGAHCAGYAGKRILGLGRITGLDPAGPSFEKSGLDDEDANFVDVIHTDIFGFGIAQAIGDADFYPNGGRNQPGCREPLDSNHFTWAALFKTTKAAIDCSHKRAQAYFTESINSECEFRACPCTDCNECGLTKECDGTLGCANMGYHASAKNPGEYYLTTSSSSPFCKP